MPTTSNFGWTTPADTDLVKDGALAIRTLGNGIDTSMMDLKGGTTGQVLSKASNTDMDFTWVTSAGDIEGVTAGTGLTGGGTSGTVTLNFDVANYGGGSYAAGKNKIINGDFFINQRGFTSASNTAGFKFDRWDVSAFNSGTITDSSQTFTPGTAPVAGYEGATYYRVVTDGSAGVGNYWFLRQKIEDVRTLANQTATISFWAKAASGTPKIAVEISQNFGSGGSPSAAVDTYVNQVTLSTSWARYSVTVNVPSLSGKTIGTTANSSSLQLNLWFTAGSNYNSRTGSLGIQAATFDLWGVQVEAGSTATAFQTATGTLQGELAACQRYFNRYSIDSNQRVAAVGAWYSTTLFYPVIHFPVEMRTYPTLTLSAQTIFTIYSNGGSFVSTAAVLETANVKAASLKLTSSGATSGHAGWVNISTANAYADFSAEL